ncbi:putative RecQ mediated genome instability protein [Blattamonas nauphoetae]|uniref:RecQ-mediated genome instability protein 1 n=1 Tax=Blattamonas nauphoetae TaxID=2049346 RepID=A0ABQ9YCI7_9EUKA|nr:putative RecQ mediated genome instability protein [Blattamonas nauphoetae]
MEAQQAELRELRQYLSTLGWNVKDQYLVSCFQHFRRQSTSPIDQLVNNSILPHLLVSDLKEYGLPALVPNFAGLEKSFIQKPIILQIETSFEANHSKQEQFLQQKEYKDGENRDQHQFRSKKRTLTFLATDGHQSIQCLEYVPLLALPNTPTPGCKIYVARGSIRRGVLLIDPEGFVFLGGHAQRPIDDNKAYQKALKAAYAPHDTHIAEKRVSYSSHSMAGPYSLNAREGQHAVNILNVEDDESETDDDWAS